MSFIAKHKNILTILIAIGVVIIGMYLRMNTAGTEEAKAVYTIGHSLRSRSDNSAYLNRTPGVSGDQDKWTFSTWVKRGKLGTSQTIFTAGTSGSSSFDSIYFYSNDTLEIDIGGATRLISTPVFRDPSAWYHIVVSFDAANATAAYRIRAYVNGTEITAWSTDARSSQTTGTAITNTTVAHWLGSMNGYLGINWYHDGYFSEAYLVDGQALTPTSFGETSTTTGTWIPKAYSGTYGTNGFHLDFSDGASTTTLGYDAAGSNDWTLNGFSASSTVSAYDWILDTPTDNFATLNPLTLSAGTLSSANLRFTAATANSQTRLGTIGVSSGKWYWETLIGPVSVGTDVGISPSSLSTYANGYFPGSDAFSYSYDQNGSKYTANSGSAYGPTYTTGDVIGTALDMDAGTLAFYKNGSSTGIAFSALSGEFVPAIASYGSGNYFDVNFGQQPFRYTPPAGYQKLSTANLPEPTILKPSDHFDAVAYTGNGNYLMPLGNLYSNPAPSYDIGHSLRFRASNSAYLNRTQSAGDRKTWTYSAWVKRSKLGARQSILDIGTASNDTDTIQFNFNASDQLSLGGGVTYWRVSNAVFRDSSAWCHLVIAIDTTQSTADDRIKVFVNGVQITSWTTNNAIGLNADTALDNTATTVYIGNNPNAGGQTPDGYFSDIHFIDGQALTPTSFGQVDTVTGAWVPKTYGGSYGTNGFYLDFSDGSSTTTLGYDVVGSNDWTLNGFSASSTLTTYDVASDTPTDNYATWNPLDKHSSVTITDGNLFANYTGVADVYGARSTISMSSGKWYAEFEVTGLSGSFYPLIGIARVNSLGASNNFLPEVYYDVKAGSSYNHITSSTGPNAATFSDGDTLAVAYDADNGKIFFGRIPNGSTTITWMNSGDPVSGTGYFFSSLTQTPFEFGIGAYSSRTAYANFGQRPFKASSVPTGFNTLKSTNLTASTTFDPGLVWIKNRTTAATNHGLYDISRGPTVSLLSNTNDVETAVSGGLVGFNKGGFSIGSDSTVNTSGSNYIAWNWKAGSVPVINTDGSSTSTVSGNTTAGFSIAKFSPNVANGASISWGHGLGSSTPKMIFYKRLNSVDSWLVYHAKVDTNPNNYYLTLNTTNAKSNVTGWSAPSTTTVGGLNNWQSGDVILAYSFAEVEGYSKFGSYTGNGSSDGAFVYTGFKPRWIMTKRSDAGAEHWNIFDTERDGYNPSNYLLYGNLGNADDTTTGRIDILSNGFKARDTGSGYNTTGATYVYAAFAESSFKYGTAGATTIADDAQLWFGIDF